MFNVDNVLTYVVFTLLLWDPSLYLHIISQIGYIIQEMKQLDMCALLVWLLCKVFYVR